MITSLQIHWMTRYVYRIHLSTACITTTDLSVRDRYIIEDISTAPSWITEIMDADFRGYIAVGSRAMVHPDYRNAGIGTFLINKINHDVFTQQKSDIILGSSTSIGAISLYLRLGAEIWTQDVNRLPFRNNAQQKTQILEHLLSNKLLRDLRLQQPIRYIYQHNRLDCLENLTWSSQNQR